MMKNKIRNDSSDSAGQSNSENEDDEKESKTEYGEEQDERAEGSDCSDQDENCAPRIKEEKLEENEDVDEGNYSGNYSFIT